MRPLYTAWSSQQHHWHTTPSWCLWAAKLCLHECLKGGRLASSLSEKQRGHVVPLAKTCCLHELTLKSNVAFDALPIGDFGSICTWGPSFRHSSIFSSKTVKSAGRGVFKLKHRTSAACLIVYSLLCWCTNFSRTTRGPRGYSSAWFHARVCNTVLDKCELKDQPS